MQFKKGILLPIILTVVGIFISVAGFVMIQVAAKVNHVTTGPTPLAIMELVMFVLFLAALSAKKPVFTKVLTIISISGLALTSFIIAIVTSVKFESYDLSWASVAFLTLGFVSLVSAVLFLVYYIIGKKDTLAKLSLILNIFTLGFYAIFTILLVVSCFAGMYKPTQFYGLELALLLANVCVLVGMLLSLQGNLVYKEPEEKE